MRFQPILPYASVPSQLGRGLGSRSVTTGERPERLTTETRPPLSSVARPRPAENRDSPSSGHSPNASSKQADRSHPAWSQQAIPTRTAAPGSRRAGCSQDHGTGPRNGGRPPSASPPRPLMPTSAATIRRPGRRATESNPARSAAPSPRRTESSEIRNPRAITSRVQRRSRPRRNRPRRNRSAHATCGPAPGSRQADATQANGIGPRRNASPGR
jgi:hypothetical protein